jgi:hypothetical protein
MQHQIANEHVHKTPKVVRHGQMVHIFLNYDSHCEVCVNSTSKKSTTHELVCCAKAIKSSSVECSFFFLLFGYGEVSGYAYDNLVKDLGY